MPRKKRIKPPSRSSKSTGSLRNSIVNAASRRSANVSARNQGIQDRKTARQSATKKAGAAWGARASARNQAISDMGKGRAIQPVARRKSVPARSRIGERGTHISPARPGIRKPGGPTLWGPGGRR